MPTTARALLSVSDKSGLVEFARGLAALGFELVSTGGTRRHLAAAGLAVTGVSEVTGFPEILDGRVKTLHPRIHGGILADRSQPAHTAALAEHGIARFDLVAVNLYPFESTIARPGIAEPEAIEMINIGGPAMIRAAAKNFGSLAVLVDPRDYDGFLAELASGAGAASLGLRRRLAQKAFAHTAGYDAVIASWLAATAATPATPATADPAAAAELLPERLTLCLAREFETRYGENPHQPAAVYRLAGGPGLLGGLRQVQGKELSWNNLLDADAARKLVALFDEPAVVIVKHNNPCGVGRGPDLVAAYMRALECDPVSAFGSIVAVNRPLTAELVATFGDLFIEVLIAPESDAAALSGLAPKKNLRFLLCPPYAPQQREIELRGLDGGFLAQSPDGFAEDPGSWSSPTRRQPSAEERRALEFAWAVTRYTKSNAIVLTDGDRTLGVGAGQMSRVDSCRIAISKARSALAGSVAGSDAFFPFRDGLDVLAEAGVTAVIQPGGSRRDDEIIAAADEHRMAMIFTGRRHFRH